MFSLLRFSYQFSYYSVFLILSTMNDFPKVYSYCLVRDWDLLLLSVVLTQGVNTRPRKAADQSVYTRGVNILLNSRGKHTLLQSFLDSKENSTFRQKGWLLDLYCLLSNRIQVEEKSDFDTTQTVDNRILSRLVSHHPSLLFGQCQGFRSEKTFVLRFQTRKEHHKITIPW
jgi:hypothetical protein